MGVIDIGTVLQKFDETYDEQSLSVKAYGIRFITTDGRLRTMTARKNVKSPKQQLIGDHQPRGKFKFNLKRHGTMLVHDLAIDKPRSVKVANICHFKDFESTAWINVRH